MAKKILLAPIFKNEGFASEFRTRGLEKLAALGELVHYSKREMRAEDAGGVVAVIADSALFTREFYAAAADLRLIARWGVGYDKVNLDAATEVGVLITITPVHMDTVAEYTIAQWMAALKRTYTLNRMSHAGDSSLVRTFEAQGSTLGLYGFGRIGREVARRARPLLGEKGRLLVYDIRPEVTEAAAQYGAEAVESPEILFRECDAISLHVSGDETLVRYELLCLMKPHASLINPSRGNLVDDRDLNRAICEQRLYYYLVDDPADGPRRIHRGHPRIICTNHNGGITVESVQRLDARTFEQVGDAIRGRRPADVLNREALEHPRVQGWMRES